VTRCQNGQKNLFRKNMGSQGATTNGVPHASKGNGAGQKYEKNHKKPEQEKTSAWVGPAQTDTKRGGKAGGKKARQDRCRLGRKWASSGEAMNVGIDQGGGQHTKKGGTNY